MTKKSKMLTNYQTPPSPILKFESTKNTMKNTKMANKSKRPERKYVGKKLHHCDLCHRNFTLIINLKEHQKVHAADFPLKCSRCFDGFMLEEKKNEHENKCTIHRYNCDHCNYVTLIKPNIERHTRIHTNEKPFKCDHCCKRFNQLSSLKTHSITHAKKFPYNCSRCFMGFGCDADRDEHENGCKRNGYRCDQCDYISVNRKDMERHMRIHQKDKPKKCDRCFLCFTSLIDFLEHKKVHSKEFLFECSRCFRGFMIEMEKNEHETDCNRYNCKMCDYVHYDRRAMANHRLKHAKGHVRSTSTSSNSIIVNADSNFDNAQSGRVSNEPNVCKSHKKPKKSNETTNESKRVKRYMRKYTGKRPYQCIRCFRRYARYRNLKTHMKIHSKELLLCCSRCFVMFSCKTQRDEHENECKVNQYNCDQCDFVTLKKQNMEHHTRKHLEDKPFQCDRCQTSFTHSNILQDHKRMHIKEFSCYCSRCFTGFILQTEKDEHEKECNIQPYHCNQCDYVTLIKQTMDGHMRVHTEEIPNPTNDVLPNNRMDIDEISNGEISNSSAEELEIDMPTFNLNPNAQNTDTMSKSNERRKEKKCIRIQKDTGINKERKKRKCMKEHQCNRCDRSYTILISLKDHKKVHAKEFPYNCSRCFEGFSQLIKKDEHEKGCKIKRYSCDVCDYVTLINCNMQHHRMKHLEDRLRESLPSSTTNISKDAKSSVIVSSQAPVSPSQPPLIVPSNPVLSIEITPKWLEQTANTVLKDRFHLPTVSSSSMNSLIIPKQSDDLIRIDRSLCREFNICFNDSLC